MTSKRVFGFAVLVVVAVFLAAWGTLVGASGASHPDTRPDTGIERQQYTWDDRTESGKN